MDSKHASRSAIASVVRAVSVLVIDDDDDGRELMADALRRAGYSVCTASNGQEGLDRLREVHPEVIFLDVNMPIMDGPHFRQAQRQDEKLLGIPTVVMTSDARLNPVLDIAIERTLRKPVKVGELISIAAAYCRARAE